MTAFENHAGFNFSEFKLQVVEVVNKKDSLILENVDEVYFSEKINFDSDKETKISALFQGAYNELLIKKPLNSSRASFALPFDLFVVAQIPYEQSLLHDDLLDEFRWELSVLYPHIPVKDLAIQYFEIDKNEIININTALIIALPRKYLKMINNFCRNNNLKLQFIDNVHLASDKAISVNYSLNEKKIVLSVYFTGKFLSIIYYLNGKLIYYKVISLTDAGELTRHISAETSEGKLLKINKELISEAFICGEELSPSVVNSLKKVSGIDFIFFNPFQKIKPAASLAENKYYQEKYNSFSPSAGISYRLN